MVVVSNTSPISNLAIIDRLEILRHRYKTIFIPHAVKTELQRLSHVAARERIAGAISNSWMRVETHDFIERDLNLDSGEAAAINLALSIKADVLLLDERKARAVARRVGLKVAGVLGELLYAKNSSLIPLLSPELLKLRTEARFFIDSEIERFILNEGGE